MVAGPRRAAVVGGAADLPGEGHTAYGRSNECVAAAVDAYLLQGTVPAEGTRC
ncbi:alpha/beta hydrolase [Cellulomonas sp. ATA003]|nr:alpha/beta hydrolase [Cellulomonas sp. ATA003]WNB87593.1 alpha/beta hydrolase [Cellulomonas sp. ATA003]